MPLLPWTEEQDRPKNANTQDDEERSLFAAVARPRMISESNAW